LICHWEYCGRVIIHPYQIFLKLNDIQHHRSRVAAPRTNGFVERINQTVLDGFLRDAFHNQLYPCVDELQVDGDHWLNYYPKGMPLA
jgi:transposase InsO family protein